MVGNRLSGLFICNTSKELFEFGFLISKMRFSCLERYDKTQVSISKREPYNNYYPRIHLVTNQSRIGKVSVFIRAGVKQSCRGVHSTKEFKEYFQWNEEAWDSIHHSWLTTRVMREKERTEQASFLELGSHIFSSSFQRKKEQFSMYVQCKCLNDSMQNNILQISPELYSQHNLHI